MTDTLINLEAADEQIIEGVRRLRKTLDDYDA